MRKVERWRYYCDHCKKSGGSKWHMENHEKICTANPDRECGFCRIMEGAQSELSDLKKIIQDNIVSVKQSFCDEYWNDFRKDKTEELVLKELREAANNCPACILSAIRQTKTVYLFNSFEFKKEKKSMYDECTPQPDYSDYC